MSMVRMPRSARSQRSVTEPQPQDTEPEELVPGRLTRTSWTEMLAQEEAEEAVAEHMEKLLRNVMDGCCRADVRQQVFPFTTNWVKKCLIQTVEQRFLCRDDGDGAEEVLPEDCEPPPAEADAWAQGCVPLVRPSPPLPPISPKEDVHKEVALEIFPKCRAPLQPKASPKLPSKRTSSKPLVVTDKKMHNIFPQKKNYQVPIHAKPSTFLPTLSHSREKQTSKTGKSQIEIKISTVSSKLVPKKPDAIQKLDPARFPDHCIFPKYEIVDSNAKPWKPRETKPQQKHMEPEWTVKPPRCEVDLRPKHGAEISSGPVRLEAMTLAKGVTLSQSAALSKITAPPQTRAEKLQPIRTEPAQLFSVDQFVPDLQLKPQSQT
ncbi:uncharacterized protein [Eucyclogobius newberryi]|uniref:uncharacterized protein n=1 Tax=Eucyclogobius newberryi TaxID=166745 RepID=UPI003B59BE26